jgi:hypothetical protein
MIRADLAIARLRRDLTMSSIVKWGMLTAVTVSILVELSGLLNGALLLGVVGIVWLWLSYRSVKGSRLTAELPLLIAAGEFDRAEQQLGEALTSFSIYRGVKLRGLHQLALLRHAQQRYSESAILCRWLLGERLGPLAGLSRSARLILADSMLELGDLRGTYESLRSLYRERLPLGEALELTAVQTDYLARIGAWEQLAQGLERKVELAELMPPMRSARVQAMLALAAKKTDKKAWETWLRRRAELLADAKELIAARPVLSELWTTEGDR